MNIKFMSIYINNQSCSRPVHWNDASMEVRTPFIRPILEAISRQYNIHELHIEGNGELLDEQCFEFISTMPFLKYLILTKVSFNSHHFLKLVNKVPIRKINISSCNTCITSTAIEALRMCNVHAVYIINTPITQIAQIMLARLPTMTILTLNFCNFNVVSVLNTCRSFQPMEDGYEVSISCNLLGEALASNEGLKTLNLYHLPFTDDDVLPIVQRPQGFFDLSLVNTSITATTMTRIFKAGKVVDLEASNNKYLVATEEMMLALAANNTLRTLILGYIPGIMGNINTLMKNTTIQNLDISSNTYLDPRPIDWEKQKEFFDSGNYSAMQIAAIEKFFNEWNKFDDSDDSDDDGMEC